MTHQIAIVAHTARAEQAEQLKVDVNADWLSIDNGDLGVEGNHRRCWEWLTQHNGADWLVVLEDDAIPIADFTTQLDQCLAEAPTDVVSLYLGTARPVWYQPMGQPSARKLQPILRDAVARAEVQGTSYITAPQLFHGVAVAIKSHLVPSMLDLTADSTRPIDYRISDWCEHEGIRVSYPQPSLVDHEDGPSVAIHADREPRLYARKAYRVGGRGTWDGTKTVDLT